MNTPHAVFNINTLTIHTQYISIIIYLKNMIQGRAHELEVEFEGAGVRRVREIYN